MRLRRFFLWLMAAVVAIPIVLAVSAFLWIRFLDEATGSLESSGQMRDYLLYVPPNYDPAQRVPLVISLHAAATWPAHQKNLTGWNRLAEEAGFIVVYPAGRGFPRIWQAMQPGPRLEEEVQFIADLLDHLESTYNIDPARVYVNGLSNGAGMASGLACTLPDRIAAIGMVATAFTLPLDWCPANRPVPVIAFHGTGDPIIPFHGGPLGDPFNPVKTEFPPVRSWIEAWVDRNGCAAGPEILKLAPDVTVERYAACQSGAEVRFHILDGAGHIWPGGKPLPEWHLGPNSDSVNATRLMWAFFEGTGDAS